MLKKESEKIEIKKRIIALNKKWFLLLNKKICFFKIILFDFFLIKALQHGLDLHLQWHPTFRQTTIRWQQDFQRHPDWRQLAVTKPRPRAQIIDLQHRSPRLQTSVTNSNDPNSRWALNSGSLPGGVSTDTNLVTSEDSSSNSSRL